MFGRSGSRRPVAVRALLLAALALLVVVAATAQPAPPPAADSGGQPLPGVELAQTLATATGIAISPLFGVSAVGAWHYWRAEPERRSSLPWFARTWFWIPGLAISFLLVSKDLLLGLLPGVKKPLDALDVLEDKVSAVLALPAVVPMFATAFAAAAAAAGDSGASAPHQAGLVALSGLEGLPGAATVGIGSVLFIAAFLCVWLASHAINVLILLSPFGAVDMVLRAIKWAILSVLAGATLIHPYLGLVVACAILLLAIPIAGWSLRLSVFGWVLAVDLISGRKGRVDSGRYRAFTVRRLGTARPRSYGVVTRAGGRLVFTYRPWLLLPRRTVALPEGEYRLGRGLLCPMLRRRDAAAGGASVLRFPPRYACREAALVSALGLAGAEDLALRRGLKACLGWLRDGTADEAVARGPAPESPPGVP